jgi:methyl-accepting chemotaxis protein
MRFGTALGTAVTAREAATRAAHAARDAVGDAKPALAIVFVSVGYDDIDAACEAVRGVLGDVPVVGGTAGGSVFAPPLEAKRGVSVSVLAGDDVAARVGVAPIASPDLVEAVAVAERLMPEADRAASGGLTALTCLVFAPGGRVDGEALVAAVRKGSSARAQLAGGVTGDDFTLDRTRVFADGELRDDRIVVAAVPSRAPFGIGVRHGWRRAGPTHVVSRSDGSRLRELDGRRALDVWLEDIRAAGGTPPTGLSSRELAIWMANAYELGVWGGGRGEPIVRAPLDTETDGAVLLAASISDGAEVGLVHATPDDLLAASRDAAGAALDACGGPIAGALLFACAGRLAVLGERFAEEPRGVAERIGAPVGGACVYGEIARARRDVDAFHNTTAVVVAIPGES